MKMQNLNEHLNEVQNKIKYSFKNLDLLLQAFTRSSYSTQFGGENNEVLEFIGDRVLDYYVVKKIADEFGFMKSESEYYDHNYDNNEFCIIARKNESDFTDLKKEIVSNKTLAKKIDKLKFAKYMYLGDSDVDNNVINQEKVKADLFEAIVGAIAIDSEWDQKILQDSIEYMLEIEKFLANVDVEEERPKKFKLENAITTLKEMGEHGLCSVPEYEQYDKQVVLNGRSMWECICHIKSWSISCTAYGKSKKLAKSYSAYLVLCKYYKIPNEFEEEN